MCTLAGRAAAACRRAWMYISLGVLAIIVLIIILVLLLR